MSLGYILDKLGNKVGLSPAVAQDRSTLLRWVNEAASEVYPKADPPGSLMEHVFQIHGDQTISLPEYVGIVRAVRGYNDFQAVHINRPRPRYNQFNWADAWRNFRLLYKQPLQMSIVNESIVTITTPTIESPPVTVTLSGATQDATKVSESIVMDALSKNSVNAYTDISTFKKDRVNGVDITLTDADNNQLSMIANNQLYAFFQIIDVSLAPWLQQNVSNFDNWCEVLYKRPLPYFQNDDDEYPAFNYDDVIVQRSLQIWSEEQEKVDAATMYRMKSTEKAADIAMDQNAATEDRISFVANPHDTILKRIGTGLRRRYGLFSGRK